MTDEELLRYARHLLLNELGVEGQERLLRSHALVVGALSDLGGCMDHVWAELSLPASRTPALPAAPSPDPKVPATATEHLDA